MAAAQLIEVFGRGFLATPAVVHDDVEQCAVHIRRHALGIAADVEMGTVLEPAEEFAALFAQAILDVNPLGGIPREGDVEPLQPTLLQRVQPFGLVKEVALAVAATEHEPVAAGGAVLGARLQEAAEGRDASARLPSAGRRKRRLGST